MKLIDCTVSAFGTLRDYHIDFSEGITCIFEENGFGKTTLATFIKAMFYGLPTARKNQSADSSERAKYYPWGGGNFGGRLTFEVNSKQYRIIRCFDRYSITADSFELIDAKTGKASGDFDENIGQQLFGVDESGFVRSTFSNGNVNLEGLPTSIRNKISAVTESADDMDEFEKANQRLLSAIKAIGGKNGAIELSERKVQSARGEIERCIREAQEYDRITAQISKKKLLQTELEEQKRELSEKLKLAQGAEAAELKIQNYRRIVEKINQLKNEISELQDKYEGALPEKETISELSQLVSEHSRLNLLLSSEREKENSRDFRELCTLFENSFPTDDEMGSIGAQIRAIDLCNNNILKAKEQKQQLEKQLSGLGIINVDELPDESKLSEIRALSFGAPRASAKPQKNSVLWIILSAVVIALGVGVCFVNIVSGVILSAVGTVALISSILISSVRKMVAQGAGISLEDRRKTEEFLLKFGFSRDADVSAAIDRLKSALYIKGQIAELGQREEDAKQELAASLEVCWSFMELYGILRDTDAQKSFESLTRRRERYLNEVLPHFDNRDNLNKKAHNLQDDIQKRFLGIGVTAAPDEFSSKLEMIKTDEENHLRLKEELAKAQKEAVECYERDNIEKLSAPIESCSVSQLSEKLESLEQSLSQILEEIPNLRIQAERLSQSRAEQNELEELIEAENEAQLWYNSKLNSLKLTQQLLLDAKNELSEKYSEGINTSFAKYSAMFLDADAKDARLSAELELSVEREGVGRISNFFSSGQQSVMDVCLRLSVIDAMFEKEKPFLLLDDPFSALDGKNLDSALSLLSSVSSNLQIIYFTCHNSRAI